MSSKRDTSIEFYRVMLMFGICLLHAIGNSSEPKALMQNILASCVVGFVFISGWFGIKFTWMKLAKLYGIGLYCALIYGLVASRGEANWLIAAPKLAWFKLTHGFWFLHAYALMMCLVPLVNITRGGGYALLPILAVVWLWGFGRTLPIVGELLPRTTGLDAYGGITLFGIYLAARWVRMSGIVERVKTWHLAVAIPLLWFATGIGLGDYNSPFAFALAGGMFVVVKKLWGGFETGLTRFAGLVGKVTAWLGPSMFSVYLMHTNEVGFPLLARLDAEIGVVGAALVVFVGCVLLDLPRRIIFRKGVAQS